MRIPVDRACFIDTNILVFATDEASPWHEAARSQLTHARESGADLVISRQVLREYLAVTTRPLGSGTTPLPIEDILHNLRTLERSLQILEDGSQVFAELLRLAGRYPMGGKKIHDANIVATMLAHQVSHLLTHNTDDFVRFTDLIVVLPLVDGSTTPDSAR